MEDEPLTTEQQRALYRRLKAEWDVRREAEMIAEMVNDMIKAEQWGRRIKNQRGDSSLG